MFWYRIKIASVLITLIVQLNAMQRDNLWYAASRGKIEDLKWNIERSGKLINNYDKNGQTALGWAAKNGQPEAVQILLNAGANPNIPDRAPDNEIIDRDSPPKYGLTPLMWATIQLYPNKDKDYTAIIYDLVNNGADIHARDNQGVSVLHHAAATGSPVNVEFLLLNDARSDINAEGSQEKGRTPLAEVVRASKDGITHTQLEKEKISNYNELKTKLTEALKQLSDKEKRKLSTDQIITMMNLLQNYGAKTDVKDAFGNTLAYYINNVLLIGQNERLALLKSLRLPIEERPVRYTLNDLGKARERLGQLASNLDKRYRISIQPKVQTILWTLQAAQETPQNAYNIVRVAMGLLASLKENIKNNSVIKTNPVLFNDIEKEINEIRTILRDAALVVSGKAAISKQPVPQPSYTPAKLPAQPAPAPAIKPAIKPAPSIYATMPLPPLPVSTSQKMLLNKITNRSNDNLWLVIYDINENVRTTEMIPARQTITHDDYINLNEEIAIQYNLESPAHTALARLKIKQNGVQISDKDISYLKVLPNKVIDLIIYEDRKVRIAI